MTHQCTGRLCEKKTDCSDYVIFSCTKVRLARFCPGDNVLALSQSPSVLNRYFLVVTMSQKLHNNNILQGQKNEEV